MKNNNGNYTLRDLDFPIQVMRFDHDKNINIHSHDFVEFVFVYQGFSMHRVNGKISLVLPGDIFFILPGVKHEYWKSVNNIVYNCLFYPEVLSGFVELLNEIPIWGKIMKSDTELKWSKINLKPDERHEIHSLLNKLIDETNSRPLGWEMRSKAVLIDFLVYTTRLWSSSRTNMDILDFSLMTTSSGLLNILEQSASKRTSIDCIAKNAGYNPEYFSRLFKKLTGVSPSTYLTSMKIALAAEKLLLPNLSISAVAESFGFDDLNYFSRVFKKETGKTPSEFRRMFT